ncbi:MAG TPA: transglutaminase-like domain-containing protein [Candidatus Binatia bacterium]|nr:transglutaminase-like domain-containing protein [Candidatus Binatia bacterium]
MRDSYDDFRRAVDRSDATIELGRATLAMAKSEYPNLDAEMYLSRIDQLAAAVCRRTGSEPTVYRAIAALNYVLFREEGFQGNREEYYDAKNSFLNEVIERKKGIPISLSVLYMLVAQRIGLALHGVGFPGHFLVKYAAAEEEIVIDPFNGGEVKSVESLEGLLRALSGGEVDFHPAMLAPATPKQILKRMLANLKIIYLRQDEPLKALTVIDRLLILDPRSPESLRDRGLVYLKLECLNQALEDFREYLRVAPDAVDGATIRDHVVALTKRVRQIH